MSAVMPMKDYYYLKNHFHDLASYILNVDYQGDNVSIDFANHKIDSFQIEYRSLILRIGLDGSESYNSDGIRLNAIYENYLKEDLEIEKKDHTL